MKMRNVCYINRGFRDFSNSHSAQNYAASQKSCTDRIFCAHTLREIRGNIVHDNFFCNSAHL